MRSLFRCRFHPASGLERGVAACRESLAAGLSAAARSWKERHRGSRTIGCFPVYAPVELCHAAGVMPFGLLGAGASIEIAHADSRFQSFVCSIAKSSLELGLQQRLEGLDGAVFHSICDVARTSKARDAVRVVIEGAFCEQPPVDYPRVLQMASAGRIRILPLVTGRYPLDRINEAFDALRTGKGLRRIVTMSPSTAVAGW